MKKKQLIACVILCGLVSGCMKQPVSAVQPDIPRIYIKDAGMMDNIFDDLRYAFTGDVLATSELEALCSAIRDMRFGELMPYLETQGLHLAWEMHPTYDFGNRIVIIDESYLETIGQGRYTALRLNCRDGVMDICISLLFEQQAEGNAPYYAIVDLPYRGMPGEFVSIGTHNYYVCNSSGVSGTGYREYYTGYHNIATGQTELTFLNDYYNEQMETDNCFTEWEVETKTPQINIKEGDAFTVTVSATITLSAVYYHDEWKDPGFPDDVFVAEQSYVFHYDPDAQAFYYEGDPNAYLLDLVEGNSRWHTWNYIFQEQIDAIGPDAHPYRAAFMEYHQQDDPALRSKQLQARQQNEEVVGRVEVDPFTGKRILPNLESDAAIPNIDKATVQQMLVMQEGLVISEQDTDPSLLKRSVEMNGHIITNQYFPELGRFIISLDDTVVAGFDWSCYVYCGFYDVTNDGIEEAVFFICPSMSNTEFGTASVFSFATYGIEEILQFCGDPNMPMPRFPEEYEVALPNEFNYTNSMGTYNRFCNGVCIMRDEYVTFLQLINWNNQTEKACTYILWDDEWKVIRQDIIPYN